MFSLLSPNWYTTGHLLILEQCIIKSQWSLLKNTTLNCAACTITSDMFSFPCYISHKPYTWPPPPYFTSVFALYNWLYAYCIVCLCVYLCVCVWSLVFMVWVIFLHIDMVFGLYGYSFLCLIGCFSMIILTPAVLSVLYACVLYFCICTCSAQSSCFTWNGALETHSLFLLPLLLLSEEILF